jgi:hypothetical protein
MGSSSPSSNGGDFKQKQDAPAPSSAAKAVQGLVYQGPQLIVSNPPHPDNFVQTIRQPDLPQKLKLPAPLLLPSIVSIAPVKPVLAPPAPQPPEVSHANVPPENWPVQVAVAEPITLPPEQPRVEAPSLPLPAASSADAPLHAVASASAPASMPKLAHQNLPAKTGNEARNILVVNALPVPNRTPSAIPAGELYGAFTVSPVPLTARPGATGLSGGGSADKGAPGLGNASGSGAGTGASPNAGNGNKSTGGTGNGNFARAGSGSGTGTGHGGTGVGKGNGNGSGIGVSFGNGSGPGAGSGNSPFPSIMIQGGIGSSSRSIARESAAGGSKLQTSYGITIVANGASGGGFKDFGVFRDEAAYTVYIDMADAGAHGSSWTLQYALYSHRLPSASDPAPHPHGLLSPPYATSKSLPRFSPEAAKRSSGGTIVVFGIINLQGKFDNLQIMQTPDSDLNQLLLDSLRKWTFRPAEMDGAQVPVKFLLGVPVKSVPGE